MPARKKSQSSDAYKPLGNQARQYANDKGETISRRAFENLRAQDAGFTNYAQYKKLRTDPLYVRMQREAIASGGKSAKEIRALDSDFNRKFLKAQPHLIKKSGKGYKSPKGPVADFLVFVGLRSEYEDHDVGES